MWNPTCHLDEQCLGLGCKSMPLPMKLRRLKSILFTHAVSTSGGFTITAVAKWPTTRWRGSLRGGLGNLRKLPLFTDKKGTVCGQKGSLFFILGFPRPPSRQSRSHPMDAESLFLETVSFHQQQREELPHQQSRITRSSSKSRVCWVVTI